MTLVVAVVTLVVLLASYVTWTAGRLDRQHARVDAAWAALDAQLVRRAAAARALLAGLPDGPAATRLEAATGAAVHAGVVGREQVENDLTRALRAVLPLLPTGASGQELAEELAEAGTRVGLVRSFHNSAVKDARTLRRRPLVRALRLAGHRAMPLYFEIDDAAVVAQQPSGR